MKRIFLMLCLSGLLMEVSAATPKLLLKWTVKGGGKALFTVVNKGTGPVSSGWKILFTQLPQRGNPCKDSKLVLKQICGSCWQIEPRSGIVLQSHDSLTLCMENMSGIIQKSFYPHAPFAVIEGDEPVAVPLQIDDSNSYLQSTNTDADYEKTIIDRSSLQMRVTDILPQVKSVRLMKGNFCKSNRFLIKVSDNSLLNEKEYAETRLHTLGYKESKGGITLSLKLCNTSAESIDESYSISLNGSVAEISASAASGIFYGVVTLMAWMENSKTLPNLIAQDSPDIHYRGLMIDVARNFMPKNDLLHFMGLMSRYKLNVLHLHLTDDEGWRLEIKDLPELTSVGAHRGYSDNKDTCLPPAYSGGWNAVDAHNSGNGFYTADDFVDILSYAKKYHIQVIPEFDFPGHSRAAIKSMEARAERMANTQPEKASEFLLSDSTDKSIYTSAQGYHDNVMDVRLPGSVHFVHKVIEEVEAMYRAAGLKFTDIHIGGDEVPDGVWNGDKNAGCRFVADICRWIKARGINIAGWQEIANRDAMDSLTAYCWNDANGKVYSDMVSKGIPVVWCNVYNLYFDLTYSHAFNEQGHNWSSPVNEYSSLAVGIPMDKNGRAAVKGLQGQLWSETLFDVRSREYALFPKMFGLVERAWNVNSSLDVSGYNAVICHNELPRLHSLKVNFRIMPPLINLNNGILNIRHPYHDCEIRYTTDGTIPNHNSLLWTKTVPVHSNIVMARVYYLEHESPIAIAHK